MVRFFEKEKLFLLQTNESAYAFSIDEENNLLHRYWGARVDWLCDLPTIAQLGKRYVVGEFPPEDMQEYRGFGGYSFTEPAVAAAFSDGTRSLFLKYQGHSMEGADTLRVRLRDTQYPFEVTLVYRLREEQDLIERQAVITNQGRSEVFLDQAFSATWRLPHRDDYSLTYLSGAWAGEYQLQKETINPGQRVLETRTGLSGPEAAPFFMANEEGKAAEEGGAVYFFSLVWSGSWRAVIDRDKARRVVITGGVNPFDFRWMLSPGESFETPVFVAGYTEEGYGGVSRRLHDYERQYVMHPAERERLMPAVYNAYGTFFQKINEERILAVIGKAKALGLELLVIDAGWQGEGDVDSMEYRKGMGTWEVNPTRFPNGLKPIADQLHQNGMLFGLWMEPETVHPESPLLKAHPDWILRYENRADEPWIGAYVLNFAMDEVREYMTGRIIRLVEENDLDCLKLDFNRLIPHMGWPGAPKGREREGWVRYVRGMYRCYREVKERFPHLLIENCAAGGMRADIGMLAFSGRVNRSDNQDTLDILKLHEGFSLFLLPKLAGGGCHISDVFTRHFNNRASPMKYQAHAAMMGSLAVGKNLQTITEEETAQLKEYISHYKRIREVVQMGDLYRLVSSRKKSYAAYSYVAKDKRRAVVFLLGQSMQFCVMPERLRLQGLEENALYSVKGYGTFTGRGLMKVGLPIVIDGDMQSEIIELACTEEERL